MTLEQQLLAVLSSMASAVVYSMVFYVKKYSSGRGEKFNIRKFAATLIIGAVIGAAYGYYGLPIKQATLFEKLATYAGTIALVESLLKVVVRVVKNKTS